jgi:hypothetical protein
MHINSSLQRRKALCEPGSSSTQAALSELLGSAQLSFCSLHTTAHCLVLLGSLVDLGRSKSHLIAENALLRKPLIILRRQVKRPAGTRADRTLLVLLARLVHTWKQALLLVQPNTRLAVAPGTLSPGRKAQVKGSFSSAEDSGRNCRLDQGDGSEESTLGC